MKNNMYRKGMILGVILLFFGASVVAEINGNAQMEEFERPGGELGNPVRIPDEDWNYRNNPPHMYSIPTGNVGIGTTNPTEKLTLANGTFLQTTGNPALEGYYSSATYIDWPYSIYVSGKYAYVTGFDSDSLAIIDVSNPSSPTYVGSYTNSTYINGPTYVYVSGKYAYVTGSYSDSLVIIDVSNPSSPAYTGSYSSWQISGTETVYVSGKYAYVTGRDYDYLTIIDISNPGSPTCVGSYTSSTYINGARGVYVSGKYAYVTGSYSNSLVIIDVSNPSSPNYVGSYSNWTYLSGACDVYVSGKYAYVVGDDSNELVIIDASNPSSPDYVGSYCDYAYTRLARSVYVSGKYAYVTGSYSDSLVIIDVSNPSSPTYVGSYTSETYIDVARCVYVSGKYAYVVGGGSDSLAIFDIVGIDSPAAQIGDLAVGTLDVWENIHIANNLYVDNGLNVGPGGLYVDAGHGISTDGDLIALGDVGVGTTNPAGKLHVVTDGFITSVDENTSKDGEIITIGEDGNDFWGQSFFANVDTITKFGVWLKEFTSEGQVTLAIAPDDGMGNPDETAFFYESGLSIGVTPGTKYYVVIDGYNNPGASGSGAAGHSNTYTDTGETIKYSMDGGISWSFSEVPLAIYVEGTNQVSHDTLVVNDQELSIDGDIDISGSRFHVGTDGNVGIGTTTPNSKLEVAGIIHSTSGGFKFPDGTTQSSATDGHSLDAADGSPTDAVYVANDGAVGIGTTNPQRPLHVYNYLDLLARFESSDSITGIELKDNGGMATIYSRSGNLEIFANNIGIGMNYPTYDLDVAGNVQAYAYYTGDIFFQKDGEQLWRMFEDQDGLYLESMITGKVYRFVLEEVENPDDNIDQKIEDLQAENKILAQKIAELEALIQ